MNLERLSSELIRHLRGPRSQSWIGRRLGYAANVVYTWESGRRFPPSSVLFRVAKLAKVPVLSRLREFLERGDDLPLPEAWTKKDTARLLLAMHQNAPAAELARRIGANRTTLARWFAGQTEPRLPELLGFVQATTHRLIEFVGVFAEPQELPTVRRIHRDLVAQARLAYDLPWSHAVLRALEVDAYRSRAHVPGFIAARTGLTLEEEETYLHELSKAGQIRWRRDRWEVRSVLTIDTRRQPEKNLRLKDHWAEVALRRLRAGALDRGALFSYNLAAVSNTDLEEIRRLHVEYYERVRQVVAKSKHADRVILVEQQLVPLDA